jgi:hypothetical protein
VVLIVVAAAVGSAVPGHCLLQYFVWLFEQFVFVVAVVA